LEVDTLRQQEEVDAEAAIQLLTLFSFKRGQGHQEGKGLLEGIAASKKPIFEGIRGVCNNTIVSKCGFFTKKVVSSKNIRTPTGEAVLLEMVDQIPFSTSRFPDRPGRMEERQQGV
jgi:hypothetical protein